MNEKCTCGDDFVALREVVKTYFIQQQLKTKYSKGFSMREKE